VVLAEVQDQVAAGDLPIERKIVAEAAVPIDLEAEIAEAELLGLGDVEHAQNRDAPVN
jgi:hypothetical protein